jgi:hypothetical protein
MMRARFLDASHSRRFWFLRFLNSPKYRFVSVRISYSLCIQIPRRSYGIQVLHVQFKSNAKLN